MFLSFAGTRCAFPGALLCAARGFIWPRCGRGDPRRGSGFNGVFFPVLPHAAATVLPLRSWALVGTGVPVQLPNQVTLRRSVAVACILVEAEPLGFGDGREHGRCWVGGGCFRRGKEKRIVCTLVGRVGGFRNSTLVDRGLLAGGASLRKAATVGAQREESGARGAASCFHNEKECYCRPLQ